MSDPDPQVDAPRSDSSAARPQRRTIADDARTRPAWNRERLIEQFQQIDASTRSEAERQIVAFEQSFGNPIPDSSGAGPPPMRAKK